MTPDEGTKKGLLVSAAKVMGSAAGKIASLGRGGEKTEIQPTAKPSGDQPRAKFAKTGKRRLPRKQKKAAQKRAALAGIRQSL